MTNGEPTDHEVCAQDDTFRISSHLLTPWATLLRPSGPLEAASETCVTRHEPLVDANGPSTHFCVAHPANHLLDARQPSILR